MNIEDKRIIDDHPRRDVKVCEYEELDEIEL